MQRSESEALGHVHSPLTRYVPPRARSHRQGEEVAYGHWAPMSPNCGSFYDQSDENHDHHHNGKKTMLMKVKEKAKKWRNMLAKKKHGHQNDNLTMPWAVSLDEGEEEDAEYHGAPMYESELAPDIYKHVSPYQAPAFQFISRKHEKPEDNFSQVNTTAKESEMKQGNDMNDKQQKAKMMLPANNYDHGMKNKVMHQKLLATGGTNICGNGKPAHINSQMNISAKESEMKQANDKHVRLQETKFISPTNNRDLGIKNKVLHQKGFAGITNVGNGKSDINSQMNTSAKESEMKQANDMYDLKLQETKATTPSSKEKVVHQQLVVECVGGGNRKLTEIVAEVIAPAYIMVSEAANMIALKLQESRPELAKQVWNKGVSLKEYLMNKLEPGEDDRALCLVITEAVRPRTTTSPSHTEPAVLSKSKEPVTLLRREESLGSPIPISTNPHPEVVEASGRTVQAYLH